MKNKRVYVVTWSNPVALFTDKEKALKFAQDFRKDVGCEFNEVKVWCLDVTE